MQFKHQRQIGTKEGDNRRRSSVGNWRYASDEVKLRVSRNQFGWLGSSAWWPDLKYRLRRSQEFVLGAGLRNGVKNLIFKVFLQNVETFNV